MALNKNTSAYYAEIVPYDEQRAEELVEREFAIIESETPPKRIGSAEWYECKWCDAYEVCHF